MKVIVCGVMRRSGTSAKTQKAYDMCQVTYLRPIKPKQTDSMVYVGFGHEAVTLDLDPSCLKQFGNRQFPAEMDLLIEPMGENPARNWVVGVK